MSVQLVPIHITTVSTEQNKYGGSHTTKVNASKREFTVYDGETKT